MTMIMMMMMMIKYIKGRAPFPSTMAALSSTSSSFPSTVSRTAALLPFRHSHGQKSSQALSSSSSSSPLANRASRRLHRHSHHQQPPQRRTFSVVVVASSFRTPPCRRLLPSLSVKPRAMSLQQQQQQEQPQHQNVAPTASIPANGNALESEQSSPPSSTSSSSGIKLEEIKWDHSFVRELPGDTMEAGPVRQVLHSCYTKVSPSVKVNHPELVAWSESCAELLDLDAHEFERPDFPHIFSGAEPLKGSLPYAQCYGGHQFGFWAGQLGDGRAITLGELINKRGERWELQLKGAGRTPYSRSADGLAVLRSSIREFLCSEAMHFLGVPTTRALCLVTTGNGVIRDMFYDGNPKEEPGAVACRVAQSFLRIGSFQIHAARTKEDIQIVRKLADYAIRHHFPEFDNLPAELQTSQGDTTSGGVQDTIELSPEKNKYLAWFIEVAERTAVLVAKWQGVGFTHGVLNTDNMSILGLTIDYGPFGFLDAFDPKFTPNTTDLPGRRYCFANQPDICLWNLMQFATTLKEGKVISNEEAELGLNRYGERFMDEYKKIMRQKLGLKEYDRDLINKLLSNMAFDKVDYTNCFRALGNVKASLDVTDEELLKPVKGVLLETSKERKKAWTDWMQQYTKQIIAEGVPDNIRKSSMDSVNPKYVLRNYLCQVAIDAAEQGDYSEVKKLLKVMEKPYSDQPENEKYARLPPAWAYRPGVCMLSCSS